MMICFDLRRIAMAPGSAGVRRILVLVAIALVFPPSVAKAQLYAWVYGGNNESIEERSDTGPLHVSASGSYPIYDSSGEYYGTNSYGMSATAGYGYNKVYSSFLHVYWPGGASAVSSWADTLTMNAGGQSGYFIVGIDISASLTMDVGMNGATNSFSYEFRSPEGHYWESVFVGNPWGTSDTYVNSSAGGYETRLDGSGDYFSGFRSTVRIPFQSGVSIPVSSSVGCSGGATGAGSEMTASVTCNAGNSVYWDGVVGVFDSAGAPISNWSLTSLSGTDYSQSFVPSIPEPATWAMMIIGLAGVGGVARIERRRHMRAKSCASWDWLPVPVFSKTVLS